MKARQLVALAIILAVGLAITACTSFEVVWADGTHVRTSGAPLVTRSDAFSVTHEWLDETSNTLHQVKVERNTDENADAQVRMMEMMFNAGLRASQTTATAGVAP